MTVNAVEATVGEDDLEPIVVAVDAAVSWMLRNALTGGRLRRRACPAFPFRPTANWMAWPRGYPFRTRTGA